MMARFVWVNNEELHDEIFGLRISIWGGSYSTYDDEDEGLIYDLEDKMIIMDFGNNKNCYPSCGTAPNHEVLGVILGALNNHNFNKESK
jgi:hypothetical protein